MGDRDVSSALRNLRALGTIGGQFAEEIGRTGAKAPLQTIEETRLDILEGMGAAYKRGDYATALQEWAPLGAVTSVCGAGSDHAPRRRPAPCATALAALSPPTAMSESGQNRKSVTVTRMSAAGGEAEFDFGRLRVR